MTRFLSKRLTPKEPGRLRGSGPRAAETVESLPALESLMRSRYELSHAVEQVVVTETPPTCFKFGNGPVRLPRALTCSFGSESGSHGVVHPGCCGVVGVPILIGIKTLRRLGVSFIATKM